MYSANPSYESLKGSRFYQLSVNPNMSTTDLHSLKHHQYTPLTPPSPATPPVSGFSTPRSFTPFTQRPPQREVEVSETKVAFLCFNWYLALIVSNYSSKMILLGFPYPTTLTQLQFILNLSLCLGMVGYLLRDPHFTAKFPPGTFPSPDKLSWRSFLSTNRGVFNTTVPMGVFQFMGHLASHSASLVIPVLLNHTIKALSPITTVFIYRVLFNKEYRSITYITLIPLMVGIMLSCYKGKHGVYGPGYAKGLMFSFISMLVFVSQNIFAKSKLTWKSELLPGNTKPEQKFDKLTILFFASVTGFVFTLPVYLILEYNNEGISLFGLTAYDCLLISINGVSHFLQSLLAFQILGCISPINYSIANILKRIIIILVAFLLEGKPLRAHQILGIILTFGGLFAYDRYGKDKSK